MPPTVTPNMRFPAGARVELSGLTPSFHRRELTCTFRAFFVRGYSTWVAVWTISNAHTHRTIAAFYAIELGALGSTKAEGLRPHPLVAVPATVDVPIQPPDPQFIRNFASIDEAHATDNIVGVAEFYDSPDGRTVFAELECYIDPSAIGVTTWAQLRAPD